MICSKCGAAMPDDSVFCAQCGASIAVTPEASAEPTVTPNAEPFASAEASTPPEAEKAQYVYSQPTQPQGVPPQYYNGGAQQAPYGEKPISSTTYLIFAILVTVMCCLPFGIPAIIYATKIDKLQAMGDFMGAKAAAKSSKMWSIIAGISIVVLVIAYILLVVFGIAASGAAYSDFGY